MQFDHTPYRGVLLRVHSNAPYGSVALLKDTMDLIADIRDRIDHIAPQHVSHAHFRRAYRRQFLERLRLLKVNDIPTWIRRIAIRKRAAHRAAEANNSRPRCPFTTRDVALPPPLLHLAK
ncbi:MAG: hypothetical protein AAGK30_04345 [Pseudomonadota bacterium]